MDEVKHLVEAIKNGKILPIYFLMGEEPYYIDKITEFIQNNVLSEEERGFNQIVVYGRDTTIEDIVTNAKRFPMMAERQVVIVKEAQDLSRTIEKLVKYAENPQPSTVLVVNYKYKKIDKRKALYKAIQKTGYVFESKKLYENQVADWIRRTLAGKKYSITPKAAQLLVEFLGTDLSKISNELSKLQLIIEANSQITAEDVEKHIGISKDFNNFELRKAIGEKDRLKTLRIIKYFSENPKDNPIVVTNALLFSYFSQLLQYHGLNDKSPRSVASALRINPYFVKDYSSAARNYSMKQVSAILSYLRESDLKSKGVGANALPQGDILKELVAKIFA
ncbi:MAG: DNA polymerase III subunit delta [bacterium]